jgi:hypothetical protein
MWTGWRRLCDHGFPLSALGDAMTPSAQTAFEQSVIHAIQKLQAAAKARWEKAGIIGFSQGKVHDTLKQTPAGEIGN